MAGASKKRANKDRDQRRPVQGSSSGETSSSGKADSSARTHSATRSHRSSTSRRPGYDGTNETSDERDPAKSRILVENPKNLDLGAAAWGVVRGYDVPTMPSRPQLSGLGQPVKVALNVFNVEQFPQKTVYQYEVLVGSGTEKRGLIQKIWKSKAVQSALGRGFIFDGNKLAWAMKAIDREIKLLVDLDAEENRIPKAGKENKHRIVIRKTNQVGFSILTSYLEGRCSFDNAVLECINFLDHLLREYPSLKFTQIKRSFFARGQQRELLGNAVEAFKGVYQSMRIVHGGPRARLAINIDVANGTFWTENLLHLSAVALTGCRDVNDLSRALQGNDKSKAWVAMKKFRKLHVSAKHRGGDQEDSYVIDRIVFNSSARGHKFEKDGKMVSLYDYFLQAYNVRIQHPDLPVVKMTKGKNIMLPMELLKVKENQRYVFKLDERQTSLMIKFAATPPQQRWQAIEHGLGMLNWANDPVLKEFDTKVNPKRVTVDGRLLLAPTVKFGAGEAKPGTSGRWDLKGKKFLTPNVAPLKTWGICVISGRRGGRPEKSVVENFITEFVKIYTSHSGQIENRRPVLHPASGDDPGKCVTETWNAAGNQMQSRPQLLIFILPDKDSNTYGRIKRSGECRYGVVTQCMQYSHVQKCQAQYISNVCMKVNAKLGGTTARATGQKSAGPTGLLTVPTVIIGADVSHAAPGAEMPSMAAMTMSMDKLGIRYAAACETNGFRMEMITTDNINNIIKPLLQSWMRDTNNGKLPQRIIYMRDGVAEGQYQHVLQQEVMDMKRLITSADPKANIPFVVIVGSKRHHVRFFPERGDRNGNPFPGTLVETGVTHPYENDFYLCSHAAIKGTARPMHYHVLLNEAKMSNEELQTLIYEHCYQYIRATTPVSQHPAIYYAHIASNRAIPHDPKWGGSTEGTPQSARPRSGSGSGSQGGGSGGKQPGGSSSGAPPEFEKLMPMPNQGGILTSMWYI